MSEFQKQDQLEPKSNGAVQPTEAVELEGYVLDANSSNATDLSSGGADLNRTVERVRQQEQWLSAPQELIEICLLYTSPSPRDLSTSRMPSSA